MLDVHPPHESAHSWKDFFIHIATICVGLLIAVGLEQSVEAIHRHRERKEVLEALHPEAEQMVYDANANIEAYGMVLADRREFFKVLKSDVQDHKPFTGVPKTRHANADEPNNPVYRAAKAGGKLALLSDREVEAFGELDGVFSNYEKADDRLLATASTAIEAFQIIELYHRPDGYGAIARKTCGSSTRPSQSRTTKRQTCGNS